MFQLNTILLFSAIFAFCESAAIIGKINKKCAITDDECMQVLYRNLLKEISDNGIPEFDLPKIDPLVVKDLEFDALGMIKVTILEGEAKGFKNCYSTNYKTDLVNFRTTVDFVCDVFALEGTYNIESTPTLLALIGGINIHGKGKGGLVAEKVHLSFDFSFEVKKLDDCELHFVLKPEDSTYDLDIKGKTTIHADNVLVGKQEISNVLVNIFNENSEFIVKSFGKNIMDKALDFFYRNVEKFYNEIPAKEFLTGDLSPYAKN